MGQGLCRVSLLACGSRGRLGSVCAYLMCQEAGITNDTGSTVPGLEGNNVGENRVERVKPLAEAARGQQGLPLHSGSVTEAFHSGSVTEASNEVPDHELLGCSRLRQ